MNGLAKIISCLMQENAILCVGNNTENETFLFHNILMESSKEQKILGVIIEYY